MPWNAFSTRVPINRAWRRWLLTPIYKCTCSTRCQKLLVLEEARASAILSLRIWYSHCLRWRTSYLYLALADFFNWWRTPTDGEPACFQTLCQRFAFSLNLYADDNQPGKEPEGRIIGNVLCAELCRHFKDQHKSYPNRSGGSCNKNCSRKLLSKTTKAYKNKLCHNNQRYFQVQLCARQYIV